jgi:hypothetical protein
MSISRRGGPRTATGRLRASRNARKDGLLAAEFVFSTDERSQYDDLRHELSTELKPNTPVLALLFELVVASAWRIKLASRCEQRAVLAHLQSAQNPTAMQAGGSTLSTSPGERSERMKLLQELREHFERCGYIPGELEQPIVQAFGLEFWKMLAEWNPVNYQITYLAMTTIYRRETFGTDPLEGITAVSSLRHR